jgi:membrane protein implicated in regulation of membrane protease activity
MSWWEWVIGGTLLLAAELTVVNAQFYLVFAGGAAVVTGLIVWLMPRLPDWSHWALFALIALLSLLAFRGRTYAYFQGHAPKVSTGPAGGVLTLPSALSPGASCRAEHQGSFWTVRNDTEAPLPAGARVRIAAVQGLTLLVRPE